MATRYFSYSMKDGSTRLAADYFNPVWKDIDTRLDKLEKLRVSWEQATQDLNAFGLERIDSVLAPVVQSTNQALANAEALVTELEQIIEEADIQQQIDSALAAQDAEVIAALESQNDLLINAAGALQAQLDELRPLIFAGL